MKPDLDAIRARYLGEDTLAPPGAVLDVEVLLAYIEELEGRTSYTVGATEWAQRSAALEHMLSEERENVDTLRARVAELEAEVATLRPRDALLKRVHGALLDMCCRVPNSLDEPVDAIIRLSLARANQRFVDEYDLRVSAQEWANELREELFAWQHAVEYVLGDNWSSEDSHDAKAARKALAEWAAKAQGDAPQLLAEIAELKARITTLEAMKP